MPVYDARVPRVLPAEVWIHPDFRRFVNSDRQSPSACADAEPFPVFIGDDGWSLLTEILDGNGDVIHHRVLWCNTETGEVCYYVLDDNDQYVIDPLTRRVKTSVTKYKPPLERLPIAEECLL